jgi:hypothetical protein
MNTISNCKIIEYKGNIYVTHDPEFSLSDLYFIAKHPNIADIEYLLKIIKAHIYFGCVYSDEIMHKIKHLISTYSENL